MSYTNQNAAIITGLGHYLPETIVSSRQVEERVRSDGPSLSPGMIQRLTGVSFRHYAKTAEASSDMAARAGLKALQNARMNPLSVDVLIFASASHDVAEPATANIVQEKTGCWAAHVLDVKNACNSFLNALDIAASLIESGRNRRILITSGEVLSPVINWDVNGAEDMKRKFAALTLGDGGGACVIEASPDSGRGILAGEFFSNGGEWRLSTVLSGGTLLKNDTSRLYFDCRTDQLQSLVLKHLPPLISKVLDKVEWNLNDVKLVVPHQVSLPITLKLCDMFGYSLDRCAITLDSSGNMAAASIPVALSIAFENGRVGPGDKVLLIGAAAGFSAGVIPMIM